MKAPDRAKIKAMVKVRVKAIQKCLLNCTPERLARFLRRQGLRLEVALLEEDQTLELNRTGNSQKANLRMYKESELHSRLSETETR